MLYRDKKVWYKLVPISLCNGNSIIFTTLLLGSPQYFLPRKRSIGRLNGFLTLRCSALQNAHLPRFYNEISHPKMVLFEKMLNVVNCSDTCSEL